MREKTGDKINCVINLFKNTFRKHGNNVTEDKNKHKKLTAINNLIKEVRKVRFKTRIQVYKRNIKREFDKE